MKSSHEYSVKIKNSSLNVGEKIMRLANTNNASLFRKANLAINDKYLSISCKDDLGDQQELKKILVSSIEKINVKNDAYTPMHQIKKPLKTGLFIGIGLSVVLWFRVGENRAISIAESVLVTMGLILFSVAMTVLFNIGKISWSNLTEIIFVANEDSTIEIAVKNNEVDNIISHYLNSEIEIIEV